MGYKTNLIKGVKADITHVTQNIEENSFVLTYKYEFYSIKSIYISLSEKLIQYPFLFLYPQI